MPFFQRGKTGQKSKTDNMNGSGKRENLASRALISRDEVYAKGGFKVVFLGEYTHGQRKGQKCVSKEFMDRQVYEEAFFAMELEVVKRAVRVVAKFNELRFIDRKIMINVPQVWMYTGEEMNGTKSLIEPFIEDFEKFNSNSGWSGNGTAWHDVMQALSHFSYHMSGGFMVLCDLQGGVYADGVVLTDPVVLSRSQQLGPTDLGIDGILTFFARHKCNGYCRRDWARPASAEIHFPENVGTSMVHVKTEHGRNLMSKRYG